MHDASIFVTEAAGWARKIEARRLCGRRRAISTKVLGSEFSRQIAVDFESNTNLHKRGSCPGHSHLPFLSEERQTYNGPFQVARSAGRDMRQLPCGGIGVSPITAEFPSE